MILVTVAMDLSYFRVLVKLPKVLLHSLTREEALTSHPVQETALWSAGIFVLCVYIVLTIYDSLCLHIQGDTKHYTQARMILTLLCLITTPGTMNNVSGLNFISTEYTVSQHDKLQHFFTWTDCGS